MALYFLGMQRAAPLTPVVVIMLDIMHEEAPLCLAYGVLGFISRLPVSELAHIVI